jgi:acyl transferase domain-containing protein/thioesterase domain-containing protein
MSKESIAIIGMGCRFPQSRNLYEFWNKLCDGIDTIGSLPCERSAKIQSNEHGGFLEQVDQFDAEFFGIPAKEAIAIDPQHRLLLEVAWEALEDAGQIPGNLSGVDAGIFVGISSNDYYAIASQHQVVPDINDSIGNDYGLSANRISYYFNFRGSSIGINASCASSLVALEYACKSLRNGENSIALACGVNIILSPEVTARFANAGMLSPDARCKSFDAKADGYVRGEGVGVVVLKLLSQAEVDGDRIYAVIRGSAVNHNGRSNGLTAPNMQAQIDLLQQAYRQAGIAPNSVHYIEAHGTATPIGDALEMKALGSIVGKNRDLDNPCRVGCVKTNIGHTEAASGMAGLIKTALSLYHRQIPPNLHFQEPSPSIPFKELGLKVQEILETLPEKIYPLRAGVSAFGFGGTNAHIVLEEYSSQAKLKSTTKSNFPFKVLNLTAKTNTALHELAIRYQTFLKEQPMVSLNDICFTANIRRSHFKHRLAIITKSKEQLSEQLKAFIQKEPLATVLNAQVNRRKPAPIYFICTGQASKIKSIVRSLYHSQIDVYPFLQECDLVLVSHTGRNFLELIDQVSFENTSHYELVNFICEYAIARLWIYWGIEPKSIIGYGISSYVSATIAKALTLEEAVSLILKKHTLDEIKLSSQSIGANYIQLDISANQIRYSDKPNSDLSLDLTNADNTIYDLNDASLLSLFSNLIKFWLMGIKVDWAKVCDYKNCYPISLPTYPFERQSYWISPSSDRIEEECDHSERPEPAKSGDSQCDTATAFHIAEDMSGEYVAPRDDIEKKLTQIWLRTLKCGYIGIRDNFFELGGNSLLCVRILYEIALNFDVDMSISTIFQAPTIEKLANILKSETEISPWYSLVPIQPRGNRPILFAIHWLKYKDLSHYLGDDQPIYGLHYGMGDNTGNCIAYRKIKDLASHYIQEMRSLQPEGPYFLMGYSLGGTLAFEMAQQLIAQNQKVALLIMFDTYLIKDKIIFYPKPRKLINRVLEKLWIMVDSILRLGFVEYVNQKKNKIKISFQALISKYFPNINIPDTVYEYVPYLQEYQPKPYWGQVLFFRATKSYLGFDVDFPGEYWEQLLKGKVEFIHVPANHHSIIEKTYAKMLAKKITQTIDQLIT